MLRFCIIASQYLVATAVVLDLYFNLSLACFLIGIDVCPPLDWWNEVPDGSPGSREKSTGWIASWRTPLDGGTCSSVRMIQLLPFKSRQRL